MTLQHGRIFGLDLLRCIAVISVLIAHTFPLLSHSSFITTLSCYTAVIGVEIFFVLSGFLIGTILIKTHNKNEITDFRSIKVFWIRRWFRTLPNYYLMIVVYGLLYYFVNKQFIFSNISNISYLVFLQNSVSEMKNDYFGVSWSLSVEEWFYLLFPLLLFAFQFIFKKKSSSFIAVILVFIIVPLLIRLTLALQQPTFLWDAGFRKMMPLRLDAIGIGVLIAYIKFYFEKFWIDKKGLFAISGAIIFIVLMVVFYNSFISHYDVFSEKELQDPGFFLKTIFFTMLSVSIAAMIPFAYGIKIKNTNNYLYKAINFVSIISYSVYLLHPIIITIVAHFMKYQGTGIITVILIWILTMIGGYIQYVIFESKFTLLREKFGKQSDVVTL